jgi:hypothetical protein
MGSTLLSNNTIPPPNAVLREEGREDSCTQAIARELAPALCSLIRNPRSKSHRHIFGLFLSLLLGFSFSEVFFILVDYCHPYNRLHLQQMLV